MSLDYFNVLQITPQATPREVECAYKKFALLYHPKKNSLPGADEKFRVIQNAYDVLIDPLQRTLYCEGRLSEGLQKQFKNYYENPEQKRDDPDYVEKHRETVALYDQKVKEHNKWKASPDEFGTSSYYKRQKEFCCMEIQFWEDEKIHLEREIMFAHLRKSQGHGSDTSGMSTEYYQRKIERTETKIKKLQQQSRQFEERQMSRGATSSRNSASVENQSGKQRWRRAVSAIFERPDV